MHKARRSWTTEELEQAVNMRLKGMSMHEIGSALHRSFRSIREQFRNDPRRLDLKASTLTHQTLAREQKPSTLEEDVTQAQQAYWQEQYRAIKKKYDRLIDERGLELQLIEDIEKLAPRSYSSAPGFYKHQPKKSTIHDAQVAVLHLSDTHIGQTVYPDQTGGHGDYDFELFLARLHRLQESIVSIVTEHTPTLVTELVVCMGGDMLHGALAHGNEAGQLVTLFDQFYAGGHALAQFLRNMAFYFPKVRIETVVGNHPRWGTQKKMPTVNRYSNLDQFLYAYVAALTRDIENIRWNLTHEPAADFEVAGHRFHMIHGDVLRGGDKALGIPNHYVGRMLSIIAQLDAKKGTIPPAYHLVGHFHREIEIPHALGKVLFNGGFPGLDEYALAGMFNPCDPTQRFFLMHPRYGQTATYSMSLKFAERGVHVYAIPGPMGRASSELQNEGLTPASKPVS